MFFKEISFYKKWIHSNNLKHPPYHHTFPRAILAKFPIQFNSISILCRYWLHRFSTFSDNHFESIMVNSLRLRNDTCYFYLRKLIHFKIKMSLPISDFSWYFSKWQLAYLAYLCDIEWSRIYFQISRFSRIKYFKMARASRALPPPRNSTWCFLPRSCQ